MAHSSSLGSTSKKTLLRNALCAVIFPFLTFASAARGGANQWTDVTPPLECGVSPNQCAGVMAVALDPLDQQVLYAIVSGWVRDSRNANVTVAQLWKSNDRGLSWSRLSKDTALENAADPLVTLRVAPTEPRTIYVLSRFAFYRSADDGRSWDARQLPSWQDENRDMVIDPRTAGTVYVAQTAWCRNPGCGGGIARSTDGGKSWQDLGLGNRYIRGLILDPSNAQKIYVYASTLFQSTNSGKTWKDITPIGPGGATVDVTGVAVEPVTSLIYAGTAVSSTGLSGIARSSDGARTWKETRADNGYSSFRTPITVDPQRSGHLIAATVWGGVIRTTDAGEHWTNLNEGLSIFDTKQLLIAPGGRTFYAVIAGGGSEGRLFVYNVVPPRQRGVRR